MRYKLSFKIENERFPLQYHKVLLSFIKYSLSQYSEEYYKKLYNQKDNIIKPYTYSVYFNSPKFDSENIIIQNKNFDMYFSVADYTLAIILYNSFNNQRNKSFSLNKNSITLYDITFIPEKNILGNSVIIKFMSPLVVRDRNRDTRKDYYYSYGAFSPFTIIQSIFSSLIILFKCFFRIFIPLLPTTSPITKNLIILPLFKP